MPEPLARLLLDTHVWLWMMSGERQVIGPNTCQAIEAASRQGLLLISAISAWEVAMLESKGRIQLSQDCLEWVRAALQAPGTQLLPLDPDIAVESSRLPGEFHGDPADRILAASARRRGAILVTADHKIAEYARNGYLRVMDATK